MLARLLSRRFPLGFRGERAAAWHLRRHRYRILARNVASDRGELDIVALAPDRRTIVVVEVKARRIHAKADAPPPEASVTHHKREKLLELTQRLMARRSWTGRPVRIDVVAVEYPEAGRPAIRHFENAVTKDG